MGRSVRPVVSILVATVALACVWIQPTPAQVGTITRLAVVPTVGQVDLAADVSGILGFVNGGTGTAYFHVAGPTQARVYTFPNAAATILTTAAVVTNAQLYGGSTPASSTGFGVTPGVIQAGSVDFGGRVTVGVGGDTGGTVTLGGTYAVAPHCAGNNETTGVDVKVSASTTVLTFTATLVAADTVTWVCR